MPPAIVVDTQKEEDSTFKVVYFVLTIILQLISFVFLFQYKSTEYIVYIFSFVIFCISPLIWINDLLAIGRGINPKNIYFTLFQYKQLSLVISSIFVFLGIFLVILSNEKVRKQKVNEKIKNDKKHDWGEGKINDPDLNNLDVASASDKHTKSEIMRLYFLVITLSWGIILEAFSNSDTFGQKKSDADSGFTKSMKWLLDIPYIILHAIDENMRENLDPLKIPPLINALAFYTVTFIVVFFGFFIRIPFGPKVDWVKVVNMENIFNPMFRSNLDQYRNIAIFLTCLLFSLLLLCVFVFFGLFSGRFALVSKIALPLINITIWGLFFGFRRILDENGVKKLIMSLLSLLFSFLGTPVIIGIIQFFLEFIGKSLSFHWSILPLLMLCIFVSLFSIALSLGFVWIDNDESKQLQIFNAILVCMAVSLFVGLSTTYNVFTNLYNLIRIILEGVFVYIVPLLVVILSIVLFIFSLKIYQKDLISTDG